MPAIYDLLHKDHEKVKSALSKILESTEGAEKTRENIFSEIKQDLEMHTKFEEEVFYPQFRDAKADKEAKQEVNDALKEHSETKSMLEELADMDKSSDTFLEKIQELKDALEHHISNEEDEMFPQARKNLSDDAAEQMGSRYEEMKQA